MGDILWFNCLIGIMGIWSFSKIFIYATKSLFAGYGIFHANRLFWAMAITAVYLVVCIILLVDYDAYLASRKMANKSGFSCSNIGFNIDIAFLVWTDWTAHRQS